MLKEEKKALYSKIAGQEKELADRENGSRRLYDLEGQLDKLREEMGQGQSLIFAKDLLLTELEEKLNSNNSHSDRVKDLERENSELKAAQLMSMFGASGGKSHNSKSAERQVEGFKLQLSEKTNEIL